MKIYKKIEELRKDVKDWKRSGYSIGLVPTMGYLHEGHGSLVKESVRENDRTVASVFLNPLQFGKNEDLSSYPRDPERDAEYLSQLGADALFMPDPEEMYPRRSLTKVTVEEMSSKLCGVSRLVHFKGVTTVVAKLLNIASPDRAYFGLKDYQQYVIVRKMAEDLNFSTEIKGMPIVRASDGLALSSRNVYLSPEERKDAAVLSEAVELAKKTASNGEKNAALIIEKVENLIGSKKTAVIEYVKIVNPETLEDVADLKNGAWILLAVRFGKARLIDNGKIA